VEKAILEKANKSKKVFGGDKEFFTSQDDGGMCLSMH
jgi:hypothetical protein